jgi:hypothetical protein
VPAINRRVLYGEGQLLFNTMDAFRLENPRYEALRSELIQKHRSSHGSCGHFTKIFAERFKELTRVPGFYFAPGGKSSHGEHWWLTDPKGNIVDPTADQFPSQGNGVYVAYDPKVHKVAKGRCPGCGVTLFAFQWKPCSPECSEDIAAEWGCQPAKGPFEVDMEFSCDAELTEKYGITLEPLV